MKEHEESDSFLPRKKNNQHRLDTINDTIVILDKKKHVIEEKIKTLRDEAEELKNIIENEKKEQLVRRIAEALDKAELAISVDEFAQRLINLPAESLKGILREDCVKQDASVTKYLGYELKEPGE